MEEKKISKLELAHKLGKSKQYISRILKEKTNLTIDSIAHIACALDSTFQIDICPKSSENYYPEDSYFSEKNTFELCSDSLRVDKDLHIDSTCLAS